MSDTVLEMKGIRKSFGATHALKDVSFTVEKAKSICCSAKTAPVSLRS